MNYYFTSESVSEGHPDKICDCISDAIVDYYISKDKYSRCAIETFAMPHKVLVAGESRCEETISKDEITQIVRQTVKEIGYKNDPFAWQNIDVEVKINSQSPEIAMGVDASGNKDEGAGDQGIMFGYACDETPELMPAAISYSHKILELIRNDRHAGKLPMLLPDAKSQVTLEYVDGKPVRAKSVVVSTQHIASVSQADVKEIVRPYVLQALPHGFMCDEEEFYVNPTGKFVIGGPESDCGLTGRKIIVDTYGGACPHGGGAFIGKAATKVDRSAAYAMRYLAKNVVAAGLANKCTLQIAYAIGVSKPLALYVNTHDTGKVSEELLANKLQQLMDLSPRGIREHLGLNKPIYKQTAAYGHFGRKPTTDGGFSWEQLDLVDSLKELVGVQYTATATA